MRFLFFALIFVFSLVLNASDGQTVSLTKDGRTWPKDVKLVDLQYRDLPGGVQLLTIGVRKPQNFNMDMPFEEVGEWGPNYQLSRGQLTLSQIQARSGNRSASFQGSNPIVLDPLNNSIFRQEPQSFTIDFWVYPMRMSDGERVFEYSAMVDHEGGAVIQSVVADFEKGRIVWYFQNIFSDIYGNMIDLQLTGEPILKNSWHRHTLRYQNNHGMLEILDNDKVSDVTYATSTGRENPDMYEPNWHKAKQQYLILGAFSGYLDDFRILPYYQQEFINGRFADRGTLITEAYDLKGKKFRSFQLVGENKNNSLFNTYLRFAPYKADFQYGRIPWQHYTPGDVYLGPSDRYIQFRIDFFAGINAQTSPILRDMVITQDTVPPPPTPGRIVFERQANGVLLKWSPLYTGNVAGYRLYFGDQSQNYFGTSGGKASPIDVGNVTEYYLEGLEVGRMYYFSLTAYSDDPLRGESAFAPETTYLP